MCENVRAPLNDDERAAIVRSLAEVAHQMRRRGISRRISAIQCVAEAGRASLQLRASRRLAELQAQLGEHEKLGFPPPLLRLAARSDDEKPYNRYLGALLNPLVSERAAVAGLLALASALQFDALRKDLMDPDRRCKITVRAEECWPDGADSRQQPDLLVMAPTALLLIENKLWSLESGDQYGPYRRALDRLANAREVAPENARAHLLAPRDCGPAADAWGRTVTHDELARILVHVAQEQDVRLWDRVLCFLVADAFAGAGSAANTLREAQRIAREIETRAARPDDLRVLAEILPLPKPFRLRDDR